MYNAKAIAIFKGLKLTSKSLIAKVVLGIHICFDKLNVVCNANEISRSSSQNLLDSSEI